MAANQCFKRIPVTGLRRQNKMRIFIGTCALFRTASVVVISVRHEQHRVTSRTARLFCFENYIYYIAVYVIIISQLMRSCKNFSRFFPF
jgi:hypothetical protein